jgi:urease subunit alpha
MFASFGTALATTSVLFTSQAAKERGITEQLRLRKRAIAVGQTRQLSKRDLKLNTALPRIEVDPETYEVRADGELLTCQPATVLPMAQRYFLF